VKNRDRARISTPLGMSIKETEKNKNDLGKEHFPITMDLFIKVNGRIV